MKPFIRTAYDDGDYVHAGLDFVDPHTGEVEKSLTDQSQMDDCDINILMQRYEKSGVVVVNSKPAAYGDITDVKSFQEAKISLFKLKLLSLRLMLKSVRNLIMILSNSWTSWRIWMIPIRIPLSV